MKRSRVAKRYAQALFELAEEEKKIDTIESDINLFDEVYRSVAEFRTLIDSPTISAEAKQKIFQAVLAEKIDLVSLHFMSVLFSKGREYILEDIISYFRGLLDDYRGIVRGEVQSVLRLSQAQMDELKEKLDKVTGENVVLSQSVNKDLLGGFIVKIQDTVIDASIKNQLEKLGEQLIES